MHIVSVKVPVYPFGGFSTDTAKIDNYIGEKKQHKNRQTQTIKQAFLIQFIKACLKSCRAFFKTCWRVVEGKAQMQLGVNLS